MAFYSMNSCKKDNLEYNTNYVWKNFGGISYYYNEQDGAMTNILGLRNIPEIKGEIRIYAFNNNNRFDYDLSAIYKDGAEIRDTVDFGNGHKVLLPIDFISSNSDRAESVDAIMQKYLPILEDSLAARK